MSTYTLPRSPYLHPDRPIPHRGEYVPASRGSWTSSQRTETPPPDPALGGWDASPSGFSTTGAHNHGWGYGSGGGRGRGRRPVVGSWQRRHTRDWVDRQAHSGDSYDKSFDDTTTPPDKEEHERSERPEQHEQYEEVLSSQLESVIIGPDGWPVPSTPLDEPTQPNEIKEAEESEVDKQLKDVEEFKELNVEPPLDLSPSTTAADSSSIEVVIDPLTADPPFIGTDDGDVEEDVDDSTTTRPSTPSPPPPPTFNPAVHGRSYARQYVMNPGPNTMKVPNPLKWGASKSASASASASTTTTTADEVAGSISVLTVKSRSVKTKSILPLTPPHSPFLQTRNLPSEYPHLRKALAPTYKGRLLKIEMVGGAKRYVDESAVFIGRLVKEVETPESLFERFSQYGPVCDIEYKPKNANSTYGTGRVLYADQESAARAIRYQNGAVSNGSGLKVELRKVLPQDVKMQILYIDQLGRPISPSMVHQYSPHQVPASSFYHYPPTPGPRPGSCGPSTPMMDHPPIHSHIPPPSFHNHGQVQNQGPGQGQGQGYDQGQGGMPFPPNFWPVYMGGPPPSPHGPPHLPHHAPSQPGPMFIGYSGSLPPMIGSPHMPIHGPTPGGLVNPAPMQHNHSPMHNLGYIPIYPHIPQSQDHLNVPLHPLPPPPIPMPTTLSPTRPDGEIPSSTQFQSQLQTESPSSPTYENENEDGVHVIPIKVPQSPSAPKVVGYKSENGVFKVVYDPDDLRRYRKKHGSESECHESPETKSDSNIQQEPVPEVKPNHQHEDGMGNEHGLGQGSRSYVPDQAILTNVQRPITPAPPGQTGSIEPPIERPQTSPSGAREQERQVIHPSQLRRASIAPIQWAGPTVGQVMGMGMKTGLVPGPNQVRGRGRGTSVPIPFVEAEPINHLGPSPSRVKNERQYMPHEAQSDHAEYGPFDDPAIVQGPPGSGSGGGRGGRGRYQGDGSVGRGVGHYAGRGVRGGDGGVRSTGGGGSGYARGGEAYDYNDKKSGW